MRDSLILYTGSPFATRNDTTTYNVAFKFFKMFVDKVYDMIWS
jgi:hypothetical protein